jgi:hypothetical protein
MKKYLPILIAVVILITSCKSKEALNYSNKIVAKEKSLEPAIKDTEKKVAEFIRAYSWDSMINVSQRMVTLVDSKLTEIKSEAAPNVKEAENFKKAAIDYFEYLKGVYTAYIKYGEVPTVEEKASEIEKIQDIVNKKDEVIRKMQNAQKKFADANGFKVQ